MGVFKTRHRERYYDFSVPLYRIGLQGVCRATSHTFSKDDLVKGDLKMVVQVGEVGWEYVTTEFKRADQRGNIYKIELLQAFESLDMLLSNRYDLAISDEISCEHFLRGIAGDHAFRLAFERPLQIFEACLAVRKELNWNMDQVTISWEIPRPADHCERSAEPSGFRADWRRCHLSEPRLAPSRR